MSEISIDPSNKSETKSSEGVWYACVIQSGWASSYIGVKVRSEIMFNKAGSEEEAIGKTYKYVNSKSKDYEGYSIKILVAKCPQPQDS